MATITAETLEAKIKELSAEVAGLRDGLTGEFSRLAERVENVFHIASELENRLVEIENTEFIACVSSENPYNIVSRLEVLEELASGRGR